MTTTYERAPFWEALGGSYNARQRPKRASAWDVLVERFSPRTAAMNAILADSESWRKWCDENPEKCAYVPHPRQRLKPIEGVKGSPALDATMKDLDEGTRAKVEAQWANILDGDKPEDIDRHLDQVFALATPEQIAAGKAWYQQAHDDAAALDEKYGLESGIAGGVIAAMSPGKEWDLNKSQAEQLIAFVQAHPEIESREDMALAAIHENHWSVAYGRDPFYKAIDIARGQDPDTVLKGEKVRSFYNNIGDPKGENGARDDVTVDVHVFDAAYGGTERSGASGIILDIRKPDGAPSDWQPVQVPGANYIGRKGATNSLVGTPKSANRTVGVYPMVADSIRRIADREGLLPNQVQAIIWLSQIDLHPWVESRQATDAINRLTIEKYSTKAASCESCGAILADSGETPRERWARWDAEHPRDKNPRQHLEHAQGVDAIKEALQKEGGFTINPRSGEMVNDGFSVAILGHSSITPSAEFFDDGNAQREIDDWLKREATTFDSDPELNFGGWWDHDTDKIVLDPSKNIADEAEARALGRQWNQKAIYDHKNKRDIPTGGTGYLSAVGWGDG